MAMIDYIDSRDLELKDPDPIDPEENDDGR
jgi:hypothetical protein